GEAFGGRDHTTVIHAHEKITQNLQQDQELYKVVQNLIDKIKNPNAVNNITSLYTIYTHVDRLYFMPVQEGYPHIQCPYYYYYY
ncbi:hypothetical protein, partial [Paenibacillus sp. E194]|uniref:hypothetical protein n=1 Tax=Paenibacillus sp. E194 TaxID=1458845 RepID=UPI0005C9283D